MGHAERSAAAGPSLSAPVSGNKKVLAVQILSLILGFEPRNELRVLHSGDRGNLTTGVGPNLTVATKGGSGSLVLTKG